MMIDTHAHYDDQRFDADRAQVLDAVRASGVDLVINAGANLKSSRAGAELARERDWIYATAGVHPHDSGRTPDNTLDVLAGLLKQPKVIAVGEIGLDFHHNFSEPDAQRRWFKKQMDFAADLKYPVVIHDREAHGECLDMARAYKGRLTGVFHCFAGSAEMARELVKLGYMLSFGGVVTFANARTCVEVIKDTPAEHILLETDCPYLAPHPRRGERNDSRNLRIIAGRIAQIKNMDAGALIAQTGANAARCFSLAATP